MLVSKFRKSVLFVGICFLALTGILLAVFFSQQPADAERHANEDDKVRADPLEIDESISDSADLDEGNNLEKDQDEPGVVTTEQDGAEIFSISVTDVEKHATCTPRVQGLPVEPERGQFLYVHVEASMANEEDLPDVDDPEDEFFPLLTETFKTVDSSGEQVSGESEAAWGCLHDEELAPAFVTPGDQVEGIVVLDVPLDAEAVVYDPTHSGGWVWPIE